MRLYRGPRILVLALLGRPAKGLLDEERAWARTAFQVDPVQPPKPFDDEEVALWREARDGSRLLFALSQKLQSRESQIELRQQTLHHRLNGLADEAADHARAARGPEDVLPWALALAGLILIEIMMYMPLAAGFLGTEVAQLGHQPLLLQGLTLLSAAMPVVITSLLAHVTRPAPVNPAPPRPRFEPTTAPITIDLLIPGRPPIRIVRHPAPPRARRSRRPPHRSGDARFCGQPRPSAWW